MESVKVMVLDVVKTTNHNIKIIKPKSIEDIYANRSNIVQFSNKMKIIDINIKNFLKDNMYNNKKVIKNTNKGKKIIKDLFKKIISLMGADVKCISEKERIRPESSEVYRLLCDNKFIKDTTNFESVVDLDQGLSSTIKWISEPKNLEIYKSEIYNV